MRAVGRFLLAQQQPDGRMYALWDAGTGQAVPVPGKFATGEAAWALALLDGEFPGEGWAEAALPTLDYLALQRDRDEGNLTRMPDHWAAYALAEVGPGALDEVRSGYSRQLAGYFGIRLRFEAQRRGTGINLLLRWVPGTPAGVGTAGEGIAALCRLAPDDPRLADLLPNIEDRLACFAGMMVTRQSASAEAAAYPRPGLVQGGLVLSGVCANGRRAARALGAAGGVADAGGKGGGRMTGALLVAAYLAAFNVARTRLGVPEDEARRGGGRGAGGAAPRLSATHRLWPPGRGPLLRSLEITPETFRIAAGFAAVIAAAVVLAVPRPAASRRRAGGERRCGRWLSPSCWGRRWRPWPSPPDPRRGSSPPWWPPASAWRCWSPWGSSPPAPARPGAGVGFPVARRRPPPGGDMAGGGRDPGRVSAAGRPACPAHPPRAAGTRRSASVIRLPDACSVLEAAGEGWPAACSAWKRRANPPLRMSSRTAPNMRCIPSRSSSRVRRSPPYWATAPCRPIDSMKPTSVKPWKVRDISPDMYISRTMASAGSPAPTPSMKAIWMAAVR